MNFVIYYTWLAVAVVLQILLFNHLSLFGGIVIVYMVALLKMPVEMNRSLQILTGFLVGLIVDIFCNTPGMHSLATVTVMFAREPILHLFEDDPEYKNGSVNLNRFSLWIVFRYSFAVIAMHAVLLYLIEAFTLFNFSVLVIKIFISVALTIAVSLALDFATLKKSI